MKPKFIEQAMQNGHPEDKLEKIWRDWEAFASYAFNKSHSTCYAWIAYQTAYLKANYPAEYMASVLSNNMNDITKVTFFMEECRRMGIEVMGPDVNESQYKFVVNKEGAVRFGMGAIKGVGSAPIMSIVSEREQNGPYRSIFDFASRVDLKVCNKKAFEGIALAGGFDSFNGIHRAQYFATSNTGRLFLEDVMKFGLSVQQSDESAQVSMFGDAEIEAMPEPIPPNVEEWSSLVKLSKEKEVVGIFITGHPLDDFRFELKSFCNAQVSYLENVLEHANKELKFAGIVTAVEHRFSKKGNPFGTIEIEDYSGGYQVVLVWRRLPEI
jgi:DNA polymerase III subunit alpha